MYVCMYVCICVCVYVCMYVCVCVCVCMYATHLSAALMNTSLGSISAGKAEWGSRFSTGGL